jgi:transposase-like protein
MRREVVEDIHTIFGAPDQNTAEMYLKKAVEKYSVPAPKLADWMEVNIPEGFTLFSFPRDH